MTLAAESGFLFKRFTMKTFFAVNYKFVFRNVNIFFLPSIKQNSRKVEFSFLTHRFIVSHLRMPKIILSS